MENRPDISLKNVSRKYLISPKTIDSEIVKDALVSVSLLNKIENYYVVGGVTTQSYLPSLCRRETSDLDLCFVRPLAYSDFREIIKPLQNCLLDLGYTNFKTSKGSRAFSLNFASMCGDNLSIEAPRRNSKNINHNIDRLNREHSNKRKKIIEERDETYFVCAPEDIALPKLVRLTNAINRSPYLLGFLPCSIEKLSDEIIKGKLKRINELREEVMRNPGDYELSERLRFKSDLFDIRILEIIRKRLERY